MRGIYALAALLVAVVATAVAGPDVADAGFSLKRDCSHSLSTPNCTTPKAQPPVTLQAVPAPAPLTVMSTPPTTATVVMPGTTSTFTVTTPPTTMTVPVPGNTFALQGGPSALQLAPSCPDAKVDVYRKSIIGTLRANREEKEPRERKFLKRERHLGMEADESAETVPEQSITDPQANCDCDNCDCEGCCDCNGNCHKKRRRHRVA